MEEKNKLLRAVADRRTNFYWRVRRVVRLIWDQEGAGKPLCTEYPTEIDI